MQVDLRHRFDDVVKTIAGIKLFDLLAEFELFKNAPCCAGEAVDVGD
jgi:hypothetical protein